jgi:hypothetical protein
MSIEPQYYRNLSQNERRLLRYEYVKAQGVDCHYCGVSLNGDPPHIVKERPLNMRLFPSGFLDHPVHLHHDHKTGLTIGAVHAYCNAVMFQYQGV